MLHLGLCCCCCRRMQWGAQCSPELHMCFGRGGLCGPRVHGSRADVVPLHQQRSLQCSKSAKASTCTACTVQDQVEFEHSEDLTRQRDSDDGTNCLLHQDRGGSCVCQKGKACVGRSYCDVDRAHSKGKSGPTLHGFVHGLA